MKKLLLSLSLCVGAWSAGQAQTSGTPPKEPTLVKITRSGAVVIAHSDTSFPFGYHDAQKQPRGYTLDICRKFVESLSKELKQPLQVRYLVAKGNKRFEVIQSGEADLECGSNTNTAQRRELVAFTLSHYIAGARLLVRSESKAERIDDMEGQRIVTAAGTSAAKILRDRIQERKLRIQALEAETSPKALEMVAKGEADGFFNDDVLLYSLRARSPSPDAYKIVEKTYTVEPLAISFRRGDAALKETVDRFMRRLISSGDILQIYDDWFMRRIPGEAVALNLPLNALTKDYFRRPIDLSF